MWTPDQIGPWSFYDQNLPSLSVRSTLSRSNPKITPKLKQPHQSPMKARFLPDLNPKRQQQKIQSLKSEKKDSQQKSLCYIFEQNSEMKESEPIPKHQRQNLMLKRSKKRRNKSQIIWKNPQFSENSRNPQINGLSSEVSDLLKENLILKVLKKKLNEQIFPIYESIIKSKQILSKELDLIDERMKIPRLNSQEYSCQNTRVKSIVGIETTNDQCLTVKKCPNSVYINNLLEKNIKKSPEMKQRAGSLFEKEEQKRFEDLNRFMGKFKHLESPISQISSLLRERQRKYHKRVPIKNNSFVFQKYNNSGRQSSLSVFQPNNPSFTQLINELTD